MVTVPFDVLEWFVDVSETNGDAVQHWWRDYTGYDDTPHTALAVTMTSDIEALVGNLLRRQLRLAPLPSSRLGRALRFPSLRQLEWRFDGLWAEALP